MQIVSQMLTCINMFFDYTSEYFMAVADTLRKCGTFQLFDFYATYISNGLESSTITPSELYNYYHLYPYVPSSLQSWMAFPFFWSWSTIQQSNAIFFYFLMDIGFIILSPMMCHLPIRILVFSPSFKNSFFAPCFSVRYTLFFFLFQEETLPRSVA